MIANRIFAFFSGQFIIKNLIMTTSLETKFQVRFDWKTKSFQSIIQNLFLVR